ncbi:MULTISPECIES: sigma-70 family RNA polymerase sigma factor [unclassified Streptomyces]|uniref:sigma-70 family RNA polymerase sigma factor n=1 Tax=unclassified Streptomyces TaxID=2593676 RepID=UPI002E11835E|nr:MULTISPECIES: sigma-70 family RNA polymerase sigma factor [unclassified Streptomyces]WSR26743.1 sigma-70 family RNA polymerase sigma factor [Streptomyces sp. NBC_01205]
MSVDGREEPLGGAGGEVGADNPVTRQVPAQRAPRRGRHAAPGYPGAELPPSDGDLIARMRGGDDGAYEELFLRHADSVRRYARTCCRDGHTADDLTAEVFARTLQAVRGGAGPDQSVRAYLLTTVRRVAAAWAKTSRREHLVEDFAVFAEQAASGSEGGGGLSGLSGGDTLELGADVRAMREAEQSLAMEAFRSLPERWQAVLWHTTVEDASPSAIAPLFGLSANATAVLARRAREGLKQAYLQAHVSSALSAGGDCSRYADRLGAYARGGLRMRAERGLRKHLEECAKCRLAAGELKDVNAGIPALLPVAVIGWFAAGYAAKAAGVVAGGAVAAGGAGAAAAAAGAGGSTAGAGAGAAGAGAAGGTAGAGAGAGAAGGGAAGAGSGVGGAVVSEGIGLPVKAAIAAGIAVAAAAGVVFALAGDDPVPGVQAQPAPSAAAPVVPLVPAPRTPAPVDAQPPSAQGSVPSGPGTAAAPTPAKPKAPAPAPPGSPAPVPSPTPSPVPSGSPVRPTPSPTPSRPVPKPPQGFKLAGLEHSVFGDHSGPELETSRSSWVWQRWGMRIADGRFAQGITVNSRSSVEITLNRQCTAFSARAGVDALSLFTDGTVRFSVYADGQRLWRSGALGFDDPAAAVDVPLAGRKTLRLVVEQAGQGSLPTLASWADAVISCR